jgi:AmmeMemoRadiSam system protein B/AmmeMemoRadiSam system protein A
MIAVLLSRLAMGAAVIAVLLYPGGGVRKERPAGVAGTFYPADPEQLRNHVDALLAAAKVPEMEGKLWAIVSPHAGYPYSGAVAAHAYAALKGRHITRVVVISPSHYEAFPFASIYDGDAYETPLGSITVDKAFAAKLAGGQYLKLSSRGHIQQGEQHEHALEVQLPFLQRAIGNDFQLVPIVVGDQSYAVTRALGVALARLIRSPETLIVASSDLSHFHTYDQAVALDRKPLRALEDWDYFSMARNFEAREWEACGGGPIIAAMIAAERLGARRAVVLKYANTGDVTGDRSRVVGYGAAALIEPAGPGSPTREANPDYSLPAAEKEQLLALARKSVESVVRERRVAAVPTAVSAPLLDDRGAFVTLKEHGELRGCIGYTSAARPLIETVRDVAAYAAVRDPRFPAVREGELKDLEYEVSVLSPFRRVLDFNQVQVGRHGLLVVNGNDQGLLLPQVPTEQGWDRTTFLDQTCLKAGLPRACWKDPDTDVFMFTALVFGESKKK